MASPRLTEIIAPSLSKSTFRQNRRKVRRIFTKQNTVCEVLESNPSMAVNRLDDDERTRFNLGRLQNKRFAELQNEHRRKGNL